METAVLWVNINDTKLQQCSESGGGVVLKPKVMKGQVSTTVNWIFSGLIIRVTQNKADTTIELYCESSPLIRSAGKLHTKLQCLTSCFHFCTRHFMYEVIIYFDIVYGYLFTVDCEEVIYKFIWSLLTTHSTWNQGFPYGFVNEGHWIPY